MPFGMNEELDCQIVELPYEEKELSMFIILPNKVNGLGELEKKITSDVLQKLTSEMRNVKVILSFPRFKLEHQFSVKDKLVARGMKDFFTEEKVDLSKMDGTKLLYASDVIHKAFIEVNEEGSEAAAATGIMIAVKCMSIVMDFFFFFLIEFSLPCHAFQTRHVCFSMDNSLNIVSIICNFSTMLALQR